MADTNLGKIAVTWGGTWNAATTYSRNTEVSDSGGIYRSRKDNNVGHALTDTEWWYRTIDLSSINTAETARVTAETARQSAETSRSSAETSRSTAETARVAAETAREEAETSRSSAETSRSTAETARVAAETAREEAETVRQNAYSTLQTNINSEATSRQNADAALQTSISNEATARQNADAAINEKIPTQASSSNQLADKAFVNSSIETATATFRGTHSAADDTESAAQTALSGIATKDNNDYAYVVVANTPTTGVNKYKKYTYNGSAWSFAYALNTSGFTAAQIAALNSGVTAQNVTDLTAHLADTTKHITAQERTDWNAKQAAISDLDAIRGGSALVVTFSVNGNVVSADKTLAQIVTALRASKPVIGFYQNSDGYGEYEVTDCKSSGLGVKFTCINMGYEQTFTGEVDGSSDVWTYTTKQGFTGASASTNGAPGFVPAPLLGDQDKFLAGDGTWKNGMLPVSGTHTDEIAVLDSDGKVVAGGKTLSNFRTSAAQDTIDATKAGKEGDEMAAIAILVSNLNARIAALENTLKNGLPSLVVDNLEVRNTFTQYVSEGNSYLQAAGVPAAATVPDGWDADEYGPWNGIPQFVGQRYLNTSTSKWYTAKGVTSVSDWVQDTNA